jgi:hypothetical protein
MEFAKRERRARSSAEFEFVERGALRAHDATLAE